MLAMTAGELGANVASTWLDDPVAGRRLARRSERQLSRAMDRLSWLIYRINDPVLRGMLMAPRNWFRMRDGLVSVLAGNLELRRGIPSADAGVQALLPSAVAGRSPWRSASAIDTGLADARGDVPVADEAREAAACRVPVDQQRLVQHARQIAEHD